jgi:putative ATP-binding cassette transporter
MDCWFDRLDEIQDWSRVLSLGEQQKMAFIRILLLRPKWLFLDEATSSLDEHAETYFYSILVQELGNYSTFISIGHRSNLRQFHQVELVIDKGNVTVMHLPSRDKLKSTFF